MTTTRPTTSTSNWRPNSRAIPSSATNWQDATATADFCSVDTGRLPDAEKDYHRALNIHKQLAADFPARPEFRRSLAISLNNRGVLLFGAGRFQGG